MLSIIEMVFHSSSHINPRFYSDTYHELPIWVFVVSHFHRRQKDRGSGGHYNDVIMTTMASQITSLTVVYSIVYSDADKKNIKAPRHWPLCGEFTGTGEFPVQRASNAENGSIWWRHHGKYQWVRTSETNVTPDFPLHFSQPPVWTGGCGCGTVVLNYYNWQRWWPDTKRRRGVMAVRSYIAGYELCMPIGPNSSNKHRATILMRRTRKY